MTVNGVNQYNGTTGHPPLTVIPADGNDDPKVLLSFGEALFYADTEKGFGVNMDLVLNLNAPAQIGNTGLIIDIESIKVDLSEDTNMPEADADGRPKSFKGVHIDRAVVKMPDIFSDDGQGNTVDLVAENLLIGSEGGVSGRVGFETQSVDYLVNFEITCVVDGNGDIEMENSGFEFDSATGIMTLIRF